MRESSSLGHFLPVKESNESHFANLSMTCKCISFKLCMDENMDLFSEWLKLFCITWVTNLFPVTFYEVLISCCVIRFSIYKFNPLFLNSFRTEEIVCCDIYCKTHVPIKQNKVNNHQLSFENWHSGCTMLQVTSHELNKWSSMNIALFYLLLPGGIGVLATQAFVCTHMPQVYLQLSLSLSLI